MAERSGVRVDRVLRAIAVVAGLYFAQSLILPIALAVVIGVAMSPVVRRLHRWGLPRALAVVACVAFGLGSLGGVAWLVGGQIAQLARRATEFRDPILAKTQSLGPVGAFLRESFQVFQDSLERASGSAKPAPEGAPADATSPSEKKSPVEKGSLTAVWNLAKSLFGTAGQAVLILILLILFLLHQEDLGKRLLRTLRERGMNVSSSTLDEAGRKVSTYLLTEAGVNSVYGVLITLGTWLLHVPQPLFWGLLAALFRFIPYIGTWMVAALALVLSIALSPSWTLPALLLAYWLVLEILTADLVEPWIYGKRTGMTAVGVMVSALFWSWLWGIAGLMVATPITACLAELGGEIPGFRWLNTLFSASPSDPPPATDASLPASPPIPGDSQA